MEFHLICIGKLKDDGLQKLEQDYLKRLRQYSLTIHEVKANAENPTTESADVLKTIEKMGPKNKVHLILLDEKGKSLTSTEFAQYLQHHQREQRGKVIFCIGGAQGHGQTIRESASESITLSPMTFPHRLARLIFVEQFYRAYTLNTGHPYHNP